MEYKDWIGKVVIKDSGKPFKSGMKTATVKGVVDHPIMSIPSFTFHEDDSYVECRQCSLKTKETS